MVVTQALTRTLLPMIVRFNHLEALPLIADHHLPLRMPREQFRLLRLVNLQRQVGHLWTCPEDRPLRLLKSSQLIMRTSMIRFATPLHPTGCHRPHQYLAGAPNR